MIDPQAEARYLEFLSQEFACPLENGRLIGRADCLARQDLPRHPDSHVRPCPADCLSYWKVCRHCHEQGENYAPHLNRIDCLVLGERHCAFHREHGPKANRNFMFERTARKLPSKAVEVFAYWQVNDEGEWEEVPDWYPAMYQLKPIGLPDGLPPTTDGFAVGDVVAVKLATLPPVKRLTDKQRKELAREAFTEMFKRKIRSRRGR